MGEDTLYSGFRDGTFKPKGLPETFHMDSQTWVDKSGKWATGNIQLSYYEHLVKINGVNRKFPILFVHGSIGSFIIPKSEGSYTDEKGISKSAFRQGIVYTRKNTATIAASGEEFWHLFWSLLKRTSERTGSSIVPLEVLSVLVREQIQIPSKR